MVASVSLRLFNAGLWDCWIYPHPVGCHESWRHGGVSDCERGDNASLYQWIFDVIPKWLAVLIVTILMIAIHRSVWYKEQASQRYAARQTRLARQLARQSYLYVGALYITYIPVIITRLTEVLTGTVYYGMILSIALAIPLQGFWNWLVFLRPRYLQSLQRRRQSGTSGGGSGSGGGWVGFVKAVSQAVQQGALEEEHIEQESSTCDVGNEDRGGACGIEERQQERPEMILPSNHVGN